MSPVFGEAGASSPLFGCEGGGQTTIHGTVFDPAGINPLYNVCVYVPSQPLDPIPSGIVCSECQAPASGTPLVSTQTDPSGQFTLTGTPYGSSVPLVMQLGKFRRKISIPVQACQDNAVGMKDTSGGEMLTRLPRTQGEGNPADNLPYIAVATGGLDKIECWLRDIGIDDSEFTSPTGHVRIFSGTALSTTVGGAAASYSSAAESTLWSVPATLASFDIVMNSCEGQPFSRGNAIDPVHDYINGGGRFFGTHYHYNWFAPPTGPSDFQGIAAWTPSAGAGVPPPPYWIDTSFPKGSALNQWIQTVFKSSPPPSGQIALAYSQEDVGVVNAGTNRWIYYGSQTGRSYGTAYLSFDAPVGVPTTQQCGRAVFSDLHVDEGSPLPVHAGTQFPNECSARGPLTQQEAALEFLFFDLSSCVSDETKPPPPPPNN
jgi:hypothetical protein